MCAYFPYKADIIIIPRHASSRTSSVVWWFGAVSHLARQAMWQPKITLCPCLLWRCPLLKLLGDNCVWPQLSPNSVWWTGGKCSGLHSRICSQADSTKAVLCCVPLELGQRGRAIFIWQELPPSDPEKQWWPSDSITRLSEGLIFYFIFIC